MLTTFNPRLRRSDVMLNRFHSCISDAAEKFSWTPEMSLSKVISQPRMFLQQFEGTVSFEQLQCFTDAHCCRQFDKEMHVVSSNVQLINFTSLSPSCSVENFFTILSDAKELERIFGIFRFPDISKIKIFDDSQKLKISEEMESIFLKTNVFDCAQKSLISDMSERMFSGFKVHFFPPANQTRNPAHAKFAEFISRGSTEPLYDNNFTELNFEDGNSSFGFKAEVSLPLM